MLHSLVLFSTSRFCWRYIYSCMQTCWTPLNRGVETGALERKPRVKYFTRQGASMASSVMDIVVRSRGKHPIKSCWCISFFVDVSRKSIWMACTSHGCNLSSPCGWERVQFFAVPTTPNVLLCFLLRLTLFSFKRKGCWICSSPSISYLWEKFLISLSLQWRDHRIYGEAWQWSSPWSPRKGQAPI